MNAPGTDGPSDDTQRQPATEADALAALARRVDEVETQLAFQDDLHRRLDETVARQDREIMELKRQLRALAERMAEMRDAGVTATGSPADEVPPHY